jgi:hypothetical protein
MEHPHRFSFDLRRIFRVSLFVFVPFASVVCQQSFAQSASTSTSSQADTEAAAKAAERKKRFEESKKALENQDAPAPPSKTPTAAAGPNATSKPAKPTPPKIVFNIPVTMAVGESEGFYLYDSERGDVTKQAQWSIVDPRSAADLSIDNGVPRLTGKGSGMVILLGVFDDRTATATVDIIPLDKMSGDKSRWTQPSPQDRSSLKIVPTVPSSGPRK